jgi:ribonuclease-3
MNDVAQVGAGLDWKTSLQELTAERGLGVPDYSMTFDGPDHEKTFTAAATVAGEIFATSVGRSKKEAEQAAAETAWRAIAARPSGARDGRADEAHPVQTGAVRSHPVETTGGDGPPPSPH